jgi:hypothetical protein
VNMEVEQPTGSVIWESRRNRRQDLALSAGTKGSSSASAGGTKRKSRGSLEVTGTCLISMVIHSFNVFVNPKRIHL